MLIKHVLCQRIQPAVAVLDRGVHAFSKATEQCLPMLL